MPADLVETARDGYAAFGRGDWEWMWDAYALELDDVVAVNDRQVLGRCRQRMPAGDLELEQDRFDVFTFRDGRMERLELFHSLEQARAVVDAA